MRDSKFAEIVRHRRTVRDFTNLPLSREEIAGVLDDARWSPSNANIQPWEVHIVSGDMKIRLSERLLADFNAGVQSPDFPFDYAAFSGVYKDRIGHMGEVYYSALGIAREDHEARLSRIKCNLSFYGAPHVALLFMPDMGNDVRMAADVGMYAQTFLLSLVSREYAGAPQTMLGMYAGTIREMLEIPADMKMLFGISFGHATSESASERTNPGRADISDAVVFHRD